MIAQNVQTEHRYKITHWFQPIYQVKSKDVLGYEALLRDASLKNASPEELFENANKNGKQSVLDLISVRTAIENYNDPVNQLFVNIFPSTLLVNDFLLWWDTNVPSDTPVTIELLETEPVMNWNEIRSVTSELQKRGVKVAVDDMCEGYSFLQQWIELNPDYIKLDRYFARNLSTDARKQKAVSCLVNLFSDTTRIIIEGIEKEEDLHAAESLGIIYAQGYLLGRPSPKEGFNIK